MNAYKICIAANFGGPLAMLNNHDAPTVRNETTSFTSDGRPVFFLQSSILVHSLAYFYIFGVGVRGAEQCGITVNWSFATLVLSRDGVPTLNLHTYVCMYLP